MVKGKYSDEMNTRPIVRFTAQKYVKYSGLCKWDNMIGIIFQETEKAYLIQPSIVKDQDKYDFGESKIWFPKSKCMIHKNIGICYIFESPPKRYWFDKEHQHLIAWGWAGRKNGRGKY